MSRFLLYARKSSESEDRQVLSIDSQIRELTAFARSQHIHVERVLSESRSAKAPGRPVFGEMMRLVSRGKADGILCWKLDRLARNPIDGAALIWAVDGGQITQIQTREKTFTNTGNDKFWMQLEFGMAKKYVDDLSDNVKRGNRAKLDQGWLPGIPSIGYLNDVTTKTIVKDPDRFDLVRKMWELVLAGKSPPEVLRIANEDWGFRTRRFRRYGGRPLSRSNLYRLLSDPFYFGMIVRNGVTYRGAHDPMVTGDEFDRVQAILGRPNRDDNRKHPFAFVRLIRCGECGASITAEEKVNRYGYHYTYYRCSKQKGPCSQRTIRLERLEEQITAVLASIRIDDGYHRWALANLRSIHDQETRVRQSVDRSLDRTYRDVQKQQDSLVGLRIRGLLTDDEFAKKKQELVAQEVRLKERLVDSDGRAHHWLELSERAFFFANQAAKRFGQGSLAEKREILVALGSNLVLKDRILRMVAQKPFSLIGEGSRSSTWLRR